MGDREDEPVFLAGEAVQKANDIVLGARVESAGHLVAEEDVGFAGEFHRECQSATLTAGENLHAAGFEAQHIDLAQNLTHGRREVRAISPANAQAEGISDTFPHGEFLVSDAELRDIGDLSGREVVLFEVAVFPKDLALFLARSDACDEFQKCCLTATRWSDDRAKVG